MRLLIVEDEFYTRQGIVDNLDLAGLGIDEIRQADDGLHALEEAASFTPDIVLTDVRMPRMDGVALARELRKLHPDCRIVFMSGYADREYLKAAIELKAVDFVDKPFRSKDLRRALCAAVDACRAEAKARVLAQEGIPLVHAEIALLLVGPETGVEQAVRMLKAAGNEVTENSPLCVAVVRPADGPLPADAASRRRFLASAEAEAARHSLACVGSITAEGHAVLVFFAPPGREYLLHRREITAALSRLFSSAGLLAGVGKTVRSLTAARESCLSARAALDAAFFLGEGAIAFDDPLAPLPIPPEDKTLVEFQAFLDREDPEGANALVRSLGELMKASGSRDARLARDLHLKLLLRLVSFAARRGIDPFEPGESEQVLSQEIERCGTLDRAAALTEKRIEAVFRKIAEHRADGRVVAEVKEFIHRNFSSPSLSVCAIAEAVGLSEAYVCRLFREATGGTVHGYVVEYRIARAKEMLSGRNPPKIAEVAAYTGFSDANYFARAFRNATGITPSAYRERNLL